MITETGLNKDAKIIDIGAGDSKLVDNLIDKGFRNITILDISTTASNKVKKRLGDRADVKYIASDLREFKPDEKYDIWYDRAVLHFLTTDEDVNMYVGIVKRFLKSHGYLIVSTFSVNRPKKCSDLDVRQYSESSMKKLFSDFEHIRSFEEEHKTPWGTSQIFLYSVFRKKGNKNEY